jgi:hypothetical protein
LDRHFFYIILYYYIKNTSARNDGYEIIPSAYFIYFICAFKMNFYIYRPIPDTLQLILTVEDECSVVAHHETNYILRVQK